MYQESRIYGYYEKEVEAASHIWKVKITKAQSYVAVSSHVWNSYKLQKVYSYHFFSDRNPHMFNQVQSFESDYLS